MTEQAGIEEYRKNYDAKYTAAAAATKAHELDYNPTQLGMPCGDGLHDCKERQCALSVPTMPAIKHPDVMSLEILRHQTRLLKEDTTKGWEDCPGLRKGDPYVITEQHAVDGDMCGSPGSPHLRNGGNETHEPVQSTRPSQRSLSDDFERLYDELLRQNAGACSDVAPFPCTDVWVKLASLLQMRNGYLEHQIRELQNSNDSLTEDVQWHVEALGELEGQLREAQAERAAALAEVLDVRNGEVAVMNGYVPSSPVVDDEESTYTDMASSGPSTPSVACSTDVASELFYGS